MGALADAGHPRCKDSVKSWTCGRNAVPLWAVVIIADALRLPLAPLARELVKRWRAKQ